MELDRLHEPRSQDVCQINSCIFVLQRQLVELLEQCPDLCIRTTALDHELAHVLYLLAEHNGISIGLDLAHYFTDPRHETSHRSPITTGQPMFTKTLDTIYAVVFTISPIASTPNDYGHNVLITARVEGGRTVLDRRKNTTDKTTTPSPTNWCSVTTTKTDGHSSNSKTVQGL